MGTRPTPAIDKNGIAWLAGEASGDYIASLVLPEVEKRFPGARRSTAWAVRACAL